MSVLLWPVAKLISLVGLFALPMVLSYGMMWGFTMRGRMPAFSKSIRRGFWIMMVFGASVTLPSSLSLSLALVNLLLLALGISFYAGDFSPAIRRYGRIQVWSALLCLADFALLWSSGLLEHPHVLGY